MELFFFLSGGVPKVFKFAKRQVPLVFKALKYTPKFGDHEWIYVLIVLILIDTFLGVLFKSTVRLETHSPQNVYGGDLLSN